MKYFVVDAFTEEVFKGNPAGVCLLDEWIAPDILQNIAAENNLSETAFLVKRDGYYDLKWFTPETEVDLCGHATLGSAFIVANFVEPGAAKMDFHSMSGVLRVERSGAQYTLDFPARMPTPIPVDPRLEQALGVSINEAYQSRDTILLVDSEKQVQELKPDFALLSKIPGFSAVVTAKGDEVDFVSRFFGLNIGVPEDPVTGSSHASLIPFWAQRLQKDTMVARQLSQRGGTLYCQNCGERVKIGGNAALYLAGEIRI